MTRSNRMVVAALVPIAALCVGSCSVNPATGQRQLSFIGEGQEIRMGRDADQQITAQLGLYGDADLQAYMQQRGSQLAAVSERPHLPWTFRVVDDPVVNAFALPGGFIYVTRGIMAHFQSEAQLAAVLGHEIGHVTARHSVEQMSRAQLAQVGLVAGMIFAPDLQDVAGLAGAGLGLLFLKFGRDDESQADQLGLRYVLRANYDPRPMPDVFRMLDRVSQAQGGGRVPEWLSTHPNPANRAETIEEAIATQAIDFQGRSVVQEAYLRRLDGMVYGENPREGFFRDNVFFHPDLKFRMEFPDGWATANQKQAVRAVSPQRDALVQLSVSSSATPDQAAQAFASQDGVTTAGLGRTSVNGHLAVGGAFRATTQQGQLEGEVVFVSYGGGVYELLAYGPTETWGRYTGIARQSLATFDGLADPDALAVQPLRIDIVELTEAISLGEFARRFPSEISVDELALINQVEPGERLPAGSLVKRVVR